MAKNTKRDKIWIYVINESVRKRRPIKPLEVAGAVSTTEKTARDTLKSMPFMRQDPRSDGTVWYTPVESALAPIETE